MGMLPIGNKILGRKEEPEKQIAILDTRATGPETVLLIRRACELIHQGYGIAEIEEALHQAASHTHIKSTRRFISSPSW